MKIFSLGITLFLVFLFSSPVFAIDKPVAQQDRRQKTQARLTEAKLKACQAREDSIKKRGDQLTKMATNMLEKFDAIEKRVQEHYTSKVVPSGKTVSNYDTLVAEIQTKKTVVQTALTTAQTNATSFTCTGNDPKGQITQFRDDMKAVRSALKDYRTSIKNLIVAVRSVSPKPTKAGGTQ